MLLCPCISERRLTSFCSFVALNAIPYLLFGIYSYMLPIMYSTESSIYNFSWVGTRNGLVLEGFLVIKKKIVFINFHNSLSSATNGHFYINHPNWCHIVVDIGWVSTFQFSLAFWDLKKWKCNCYWWQFLCCTCMWSWSSLMGFINH
jgi:hypothetical protein